MREEKQFLPPSSESIALRKVASEFVEGINKRGIHSMFLFGSAAWGDADASSDVDIMIVNIDSAFRFSPLLFMVL